MTQYTFDWENETGIDLKEAGIRTVTSNTPEGYREAFDRVLDELASTGLEFTSEDVTSVVGQPPNHPNAVGAIELPFTGPCLAPPADALAIIVVA